jgi:hypothetical protein
VRFMIGISDLRVPFRYQEASIISTGMEAY